MTGPITAGTGEFTWLRIVGGVVFLSGGVLPLVWLVISKRKEIRVRVLSDIHHQSRTKELV